MGLVCTGASEMMRKFLAVAAAAACLLGGAPAVAATVYEQPLFNGPDGGPYSIDVLQVVAAGFELGAEADITRVSWYGSGLVSEDFGDFKLRFYAESGDEPDTPGSVLYSHTAAGGKADTGLINGYGDRVFRFSMDIPTFHAAAGVRYFFSVADLTEGNFIWSLSNTDCCSLFNMNGFGWSVDRDRDSNAFALHDGAAVPEPSTWTVLILGFAASGIALRRRRPAVAQVAGGVLSGS